MSALLLTPSELGVTCILSSKPWISLWFPLDFIGEVQWDFNSRLMISNFDWTYLRAQKEFEGVLTCKQEVFLLVWMIPTFLRAHNTSFCSPHKNSFIFPYKCRLPGIRAPNFLRCLISKRSVPGAYAKVVPFDSKWPIVCHQTFGWYCWGSPRGSPWRSSEFGSFGRGLHTRQNGTPSLSLCSYKGKYTMVSKHWWEASVPARRHSVFG